MRESEGRAGGRATHAEQARKLLDLEFSTGPLPVQREDKFLWQNGSHCDRNGLSIRRRGFPGIDSEVIIRMTRERRFRVKSRAEEPPDMQNSRIGVRLAVLHLI